MALNKTDLKSIKSVVDQSIKDADLATNEYVKQGFDKMSELIGDVETHLGEVETNLTKEIQDLAKVVDVHSAEIMKLKAK